MEEIKELGVPVFTNRDVCSAIEKIGWEKYIEEIRKGFKHSATGKAEIPHKIYVNTPFDSDMRCMPAYLTEYEGGKYVGVKIVSVAPKNRMRQLPTVLGEYILREAETMRLLAIMQAEELTAYRTGATTAVATEALSRSNVRSMCMIAAGKQSFYQAKGILTVRPSIEKIKVFDTSTTAVRNFKTHQKELEVNIDVSKTLEETINGVDIVTTVTTAEKPFISPTLIADGVHINSIGADSRHKIEFETGLLRRAKVFVDDVEQCRNSGEVYQGLKMGIISNAALIPLGDVLTGKAKGRTSDREITFFKSTGVAHEDLITTIMVYEESTK